VGDSKGAALESRARIAQSGGYYLFPVAMKGKIPEMLAEWVRQPPVEPRVLILEEVEEGEKRQPIGKGLEIDKTMAVEWGKKKYEWQERWLIIKSDRHAKRQQAGFLKSLNKAEKELEKLYPQATEDREEFLARANKILEKQGVNDFLGVQIDERITHQKRYLKRGRPGPRSPYKWEEIREYRCRSQRNEEAIERHCELFGWRIYTTNVEKQKMSLEQSVKYYRDEWTVERGFHRLKRGCLPVLPLFIRIPERIKGLLLLLFIALQVLTLMEFVVRRELSKKDEKLAGLVPGNPKIETARPTAERLLSAFKELHLLIEHKGSEITGHLIERLTPLQEKILTLLKVPQEIYNLSFSEPTVKLCTEFNVAA